MRHSARACELVRGQESDHETYEPETYDENASTIVRDDVIFLIAVICIVTTFFITVTTFFIAVEVFFIAIFMAVCILRRLPPQGGYNSTTTRWSSCKRKKKLI